MNINENQIIDYLDGNLLPANLKLFEAEMKTNSVLREAVQAQQLVNQALAFDQDQNLKATLKLWNDTEKKKEDISTAKTFRLHPRWLAVAASLIVIFTAFFLLNRPSDSERLFASYYAEPTAGISRDINNEAVSEAYLGALKHYAAKNYDLALLGFKDVKRDDPFFEESTLLTADCYIKLQDWTAALQTANIGLNHPKASRLFKERMEWTKILLLIQSKELDSASQLNDNVILHSNHLFRSRALALKKELES